MKNYIPSYPIPSKRDQAYILLTLAIGTAKRFIPQLNTFVEFEDSQESKLLNLGEDILVGKIESEKFITEFEKALKTYDKTIKLDDNCKSFIQQRLDLSKGSSRPTKDFKTSTEKETDKKVDKKGILKEGEQDFRRIIQELCEAIEALLNTDESDVETYTTAVFNAATLVDKYKR
jgi:hypothetical protein